MERQGIIFPASFRADAKRALKRLSELSFGAISSYRIFDGGIDPNGPDYVPVARGY